MPVDEATTMKMHSKVRWGNVEEVETLLKTDGVANCQDAKTGNTPIHIAAQNGHRHIVKMLLDAGANVNAQNNNGLTALHMSVEYDYYFTSKMLIEAGADGEIVSGEGAKASTGIEGENCIEDPTACFSDAQTTAEVELALEMAKANPEGCDKMVFVQKFMMRKKSDTAIFTPELNKKCQEIIKML